MSININMIIGQLKNEYLLFLLKETSFISFFLILKYKKRGIARFVNKAMHANTMKFNKF